VDSYEEFQRHNQSYESVTSFNPFYGNSEYTMTGAGEPLGISGVMVAGNFFETLGVQPAMGRLFTQEEVRKGGAKALLISDGLWRRQFHSDPRVVGQVVDLNKVPYTIVGVLPASFDFGAVFAPGMRFDAFEPAPMDTLRTWGNTLAVAGRLKPGVTVGQAQAEADALFVQLQAAHKDWQMDYTPKMVGLKEYVSGGLRRSVMVLWLAVGLMLLIVCVNLSSLLVARATARTKEFAMRMALGAGRGRLVRQLLTESLVIASAGTVLGLALAFSIVNYLARQEAIAVPLLNGVHVDAKALGWTLVLTMTTTLAFGLTPALRVRVQGLQEALKDGGHGTSSGGRPERVRSAMVVAEVALTCVLLVGAGLLMRSFLNTVNEEIGFEPSHGATMRVDYDQSAPGNQRATVLREMLRRVGEIPGVESAGIADMLPLGRNRSWGMASRERGFQKDEDNGAMVRIVTPGYLGAMGMRLRGRDFNWQDTAIAKGENREQAVIINEAAARQFFPGKDALGQAALVNGPARVVGVVADVRQTSLEVAPGPEMYLSVMQADPEGAELVVRSTLPASTLAPSVRAALREVNAGQPGYELRPLGSIVDHAVSPRRFFLVLVMSFAGLGLVLASLGIYGVIAYSVAQRTQEIGIRMALGSTAEQVQRRVMAKTLRLAGMGVAVGTLASLGMARGMAALLYGTAVTDLPTYAGMVGLLLGVAAVAGYLPARKAARINPAVALRQ